MTLRHKLTKFMRFVSLVLWIIITRRDTDRERTSRFTMCQMLGDAFRKQAPRWPNSWTQLLASHRMGLGNVDENLVDDG